MVRKNLVNAITNIKRISNRNISIQIKISKKKTNLEIINTYAPHMGYNKGERTEYWKEVNKTLEQNNKNDCIIRCTDNNGQISNDGNNTNDKNIGNWSYSDKTETGNGDKLKKNIIKHNLAAANTLFNPENNNKDALVTWISGGNNIKKQLDYVMISQKHKNWVNNARTKGIANINQLYQHRIIQMDITMKLKENKTSDDKKINKNYNINKLRMNPSELEMDNMMSKEDISNMIRNEEKENNKQFSNWGRYDHRTFNNKLWNNANKILDNIQEGKSPNIKDDSNKILKMKNR